MDQITQKAGQTPIPNADPNPNMDQSMQQSVQPSEHIDIVLPEDPEVKPKHLIETRRPCRYYVFIVFCMVFFLMTSSLLISWKVESELRLRISLLNKHLDVQQKSCMQRVINLMQLPEQKQECAKYDTLDKQQVQLLNELMQTKAKLLESNAKLFESEIQVNRTQIDVDFCRTELQSLKHLYLTHRETWEDVLAKKRSQIQELEKEIQLLKQQNLKPDESAVNMIDPSTKSINVSSQATTATPSLSHNNVTTNKPIRPEPLRYWSDN